MHKIDIAAIISQFAGLSLLASDATFQSNLVIILGSSAPKIVAYIGLLAVLASTVLRVIGSPTPVSQGASK